MVFFLILAIHWTAFPTQPKRTTDLMTLPDFPSDNPLISLNSITANAISIARSTSKLGLIKVAEGNSNIFKVYKIDDCLQVPTTTGRQSFEGQQVSTPPGVIPGKCVVASKT